MNRRLLVACQLWPSVSPHGAEVPESIWNLTYSVWLAMAATVDNHLAAMRQQNGT